MGQRAQREVVVITGASAGVGRATAQLFARRGAHLGLIARGREGLEETRHDVESSGGRAMTFAMDVADAEEVAVAAGQVEQAFGPIDIWVNNAMVSILCPVKELAPDEIRRVTDVTYLGYVYGTLAALKYMLPRDRGVIVQVGSTLAHRAIPLQAPYCGAKHAIRGFTQSLRCELLHDRSRVRVTMVQLPAVNTPQFRWIRSCLPNKPQPVPPIFQPELAAEAIVCAAHHPRRELLVGFSTACFVVGNALFPALGDWYLARTGYRSQQTSEPADPIRRDNLWEPLPLPHTAHGDFDSRAFRIGIQLWITTHRRGLLAGLAAAVMLR